MANVFISYSHNGESQVSRDDSISASTVKTQLEGKWVGFTSFMLIDIEHDDEAENSQRPRP